MTPQTFIEKIIKGGWRPKARDGVVMKNCQYFTIQEYGTTAHFTDQPNRNVKKDFVNVRIEVILLDPRAWQAVGKVEGWETEKVQRWLHTKTFDSNKRGKIEMYDESRGFILDTQAMLHWHQMLDALAKGKTIEEALKTL